MHAHPNDRRICQTTHERSSLGRGTWRNSLLSVMLPVSVMLLATMMLSAGGGGSSNNSATQIPLTLSGNWQFTMSPQVDQNNQVLYLGGLEGGFLLQNSGSAKGSTEYAVSIPGILTPCSAGSATVTGTISGQNVNLTAMAGTQTFTLTGTLSLDSSTMSGTYTSTAGTASDGSPCGSAEPPAGLNISGLQWSAALVPPMTGPFQGNFLSMGGSTALQNEDFSVWGSLTQAQNAGASSAALTGALNVGTYPCLATASVYGQISGNSVTLQILGSDQSILGLIGEPVDSNGATGLNPVNVEPVEGGYVLSGVGPSYLLATSVCPGNVEDVDAAGNFGSVCLGLNGASCPQAADLTSPAAKAAGPALTTPAHAVPVVASPSNRNLQDVEHHAEID